MASVLVDGVEVLYLVVWYKPVNFYLVLGMMHVMLS